MPVFKGTTNQALSVLTPKWLHSVIEQFEFKEFTSQTLATAIIKVTWCKFLCGTINQVLLRVTSANSKMYQELLSLHFTCIEAGHFLKIQIPKFLKSKLGQNLGTKWCTQTLLHQSRDYYHFFLNSKMTQKILFNQVLQYSNLQGQPGDPLAPCHSLDTLLA